MRRLACRNGGFQADRCEAAVRVWRFGHRQHEVAQSGIVGEIANGAFASHNEADAVQRFYCER